MNFISSSLLVISSTEMIIESLNAWKNAWRSAVQGGGVCPQGESLLTKRAGGRHLRAWSHLVLHLKVSAPRLLAAPSSDGAGLVALKRPSRTCQQDQDGLNTLTKWSNKILGCTHPRATLVAGGQSRGEKLHTGLTSLTSAQLSSSLLSKLSFPSLECKGCHDLVSSIHSSLPKGCGRSRTPSLRGDQLPDPACCFPSKLRPSLGKLNALRKYHWGNKSVVRAYWSVTFVFNVQKGDSFVTGLAPSSCYSRFSASPDTAIGRLTAESAEYLLITGGTERTWNSLVTNLLLLEQLFPPLPFVSVLITALQTQFKSPLQMQGTVRQAHYNQHLSS